MPEENKVEEQDLMPKEVLMKRGNKIIVKQVSKEFVLTPEKIVHAFNQNNANLAKQKHQIEQLEGQLKNAKAVQEQMEKKVEELGKYYPDAYKETHKKARSIIGKIKDKAIADIKEVYVRDVAVTDEQARIELFHQWRKKIHTTPSLAQNIPDPIIREILYGPKAILKPSDVQI